MLKALAVVLAAGVLVGAAPADWRMLDPENTLVIDSTRGRIVVELRPDIAPLGVARIKLLARERVYDGLQFHRVIDGFVAQTGNPNNRDGGVSAHPDLAPEFSFRLAAEAATVVVERSDAREGFVGSVPFAAVSSPVKVATVSSVQVPFRPRVHGLPKMARRPRWPFSSRKFSRKAWKRVSQVEVAGRFQVARRCQAPASGA